MSYILDALKKAERERGIARVPTLTTVHELGAMPQVRRWIIPGALVLIAAAGLWFFLPSPGKNTGTRPAPANESDRVPAVSPAGTEQPKPSVSAGDAPTSPRKLLLPAPAADARKSLPDVAEEKSAIEKPRPVPPSRPAAAPRPIWDRPEVPQAQPSPGDFAEEIPAAKLAKPVPLREAVTRMNMTMHMFSEIKAERLVFINGRKYVEGDFVEGRYLLEQITLEGAVLSYEGERVVLKPGTK